MTWGGAVLEEENDKTAAFGEDPDKDENGWNKVEPRKYRGKS
jgi:hypothetical protein